MLEIGLYASKTYSPGTPFLVFLTSAPKGGVIVVACAVRASAVVAAAAGINLVGVPQT